jgi:NAD+ kinase
MRLGVVAQKGNERAVELAAGLADDLGSDDVEVALDTVTAEAADRDGVALETLAEAPLVVSVGGDGTFLFTARHVGSTPILGVNLGEVGFLNGVSPEEATDRIRDELDRIRETGEPRYREVPRVKAWGDGWESTPGLNEIVVQGPQRGHGQGVDLEVRVDGSLYESGHADGVLVATQTGSTAYNLSEGGPLVHPSVRGFVITDMNAEAAMPPLVIDPEDVVTLQATGADRVAVSSDGNTRWLDAPTEIQIGQADEPCRIAGPPSDFFRALNKID